MIQAYPSYTVIDSSNKVIEVMVLYVTISMSALKVQTIATIIHFALTTKEVLTVRV